ncbi:MAG: hypothetical protein ABID54_11085 [Pseudomonadota bacterium]
MRLEMINLMEGARNYVRNYGQVKAGEKVVIITDPQTDSLVVEAITLACNEAGVQEVVVTIHPGPLGLTLETYFDYFLKPWPESVQHAALHADVLFNATLTAEGRLGFRRLMAEHGVRSVRLSHVIKREQLAGEFGRFPFELRQIIASKLLRQVESKRHWRHVDPEGTDISFDRLMKSDIGGIQTSHEIKGFVGMQEILVGLEPDSPTCNGVIVSSTNIFGPIPSIRLNVEKGRVVNLEGGGNLGIRFKRLFQEYKDEQFGDFGPGVDWIDELMFAGHPKGTSSRMAGAIHHSVGGGPGSHGKVGRKTGGPAPAHYGIVTFEPTLTADSETIIERGEMTIFRDPEIREVAAKYGDPDLLLARSGQRSRVMPIAV